MNTRVFLLAIIILFISCKGNDNSSQATNKDLAKANLYLDTITQETPIISVSDTTQSIVTTPSIDSLPIDDSILSTQTKKAAKVPKKEKKILKKSSFPTIFDLKYITGKFDQRKHPDFVRLDDRYCAYPDMYLRKEVYAAFLKMREAAQKEKINLVIRSATRNFFSQRRIWENKWTGKRKLAGGENLAKTKNPILKAKKILLYSSMPGSSRHHWGTDIDLNDLANSYFESGKGYKMYQWMLTNAHNYGFYQVYTKKGPERPKGYNEERWHWTYLPTSKKILDVAKTELKDKDFSGFLGSHTAPKIHIVRDYVLGINKACL